MTADTPHLVAAVYVLAKSSPELARWLVEIARKCKTPTRKSPGLTLGA